MANRWQMMKIEENSVFGKFFKRERGWDLSWYDDSSVVQCPLNLPVFVTLRLVKWELGLRPGKKIAYLLGQPSHSANITNKDSAYSFLEAKRTSFSAHLDS